MKTSVLALGLALSLGAGAVSITRADIFVGDRRFEVLEALGQPNGCVGSDRFQVCYYDRGEVVFRGGVVESHTIVSVEEAERRQAAAAAEREARLEQEREIRETRIAEGLAIFEEKVSDPHFHDLPPMSRFKFWQVFRQKYPEIDVDLEFSMAYEEARQEHAERLARIEADRRLRELELRVAEAEEQARRAEREAERARYERSRRTYDDSVVYVNSRPVVVHPSPPHKHRPPREQPAPPKADPPPPADSRDARRVAKLKERLQPENFMFPPLEDPF